MTDDPWARVRAARLYTEWAGYALVGATILSTASLLRRSDVLDDAINFAFGTHLGRQSLSLWLFVLLAALTVVLWAAYRVARVRAWARTRYLQPWCLDCHQEGVSQPGWPRDQVVYPTQCEHCGAPERRVVMVEDRERSVRHSWGSP